MEIRRYKRGEEGAVWNVYSAATRVSVARDYHADLIERWAPRDPDMSNWARRLEQKNPFVAVVEGEIVGMAEIETNGFIDYFYVHPNWQGRGIGKALLAAIEAEVNRFGAKLIFADVSITAKSFFLSRGFQVTEARSNVVLGHPAPNYRMQKRLVNEPDGPATERADSAKGK